MEAANTRTEINRVWRDLIAFPERRLFGSNNNLKAYLCTWITSTASLKGLIHAPAIVQQGFFKPAGGRIEQEADKGRLVYRARLYQANTKIFVLFVIILTILMSIPVGMDSLI